MNSSPPTADVAWDAATACTAFDGSRRIAAGPLATVAAAAKAVLARRGERAAVLIFDDATGRSIEVDFRGTARAVVARLPAAAAAVPIEEAEADAPRGRGRPRLGVLAREVTLLPRHWAWLAEQPGGASVALRKLVEAARRGSAGADRRRRAQEAAYRFMSAMAGDRPGFEEATRALFAGRAAGLAEHAAAWPADVRAYALALARDAVVTAAEGGRPTD